MQCINFCFYSECFIEEPCAGNPQARFCGGYHNTYTNFRHMLWFLPDIEEIVSIRERAQVIHEELNNHLTERLSASTNKLSAIASIFLPMSFVTGLFGVNLAGIPSAASDKSFPIFASIICAILIIQFVILKWKKWF